MDRRVEFLTKNRRYRIVYMDGEYYIIDIEKSFWLIFLPILIWLIPQKMYKIDAEIVEQLKTSTKRSGSQVGIVMIGAGGASILAPIVKPILDHTIESSLLVNWTLLIGVTSLIILLRLYLSQFLRSQLDKKINISNLETIMMKTKPKYFRQYSTPFFISLFFGLFTLGMFYSFLITSDLIPLVAFIIILPLVTLLNWAFINPDFGKTNLYKVSHVN